MARAPKQNPDRTMCDKGRLIWGGTVPIQSCPKEDRPPADQPRHEDLARIVLWWKARMPGVDIFLSRKDVKVAF
eukprot:403145-Pyramimonas_sp.AAC.1